MGSIVDRFNTVTVDDIPIPPMRTLTESQVNIIQKTWEIPAAKPLDSGETILYLFLEKFPHNQQRFASFKSHAGKIMNTLANAVDCLDKEGGMDEIVRALNEMGKSHRRRGIPKKAFVELREVLEDVLAKVCHLDEEGKIAWSHLIDIVFHIVFTNLDANKIK